MKLLFDTHAFLWYVEGTKPLPETVTQLVDNLESELFLSMVSVWEIAIKLAIGKLKLHIPLGDFLKESIDRYDLKMLGFTLEDCERYIHLPLHHRDPFDRMLIVQAMQNQLVLISTDAEFDAYPIHRIW